MVGSTQASARPDVVAAVDAMRRIMRALRRAARQTQVAAGMSAAQLFVLRALENGEPASLSELAERTMTDRTSVAAVLTRLVAGNLVTREVADDDRRRAAITITRTGRAALKYAPQAPTALLVAGLEGLQRADQRAVAQGLTALCRSMALDQEPAGMLFEDEVPAAG